MSHRDADDRPTAGPEAAYGPRNPAEIEPAAGQRIGHFELRSELGRGAAGTAWLAEDLDIPDRRVALKLMRAGGIAPDLAALRREASALAALRHPHILVVHEIGTAPQGVFLVTELMDGGSVAERLEQGPLALGAVLALGRATADALRAAHAEGILHRDVKAANLLLDRDGCVKVADFGLALRDRALVTGGGRDPSSAATVSQIDAGPPVLAGTPGYIAPEVLSGALPSARSDMFAFGVTLHEVLTGRRPFDGAVHGEPRIDPRLPRDVARIVRGCIEREPGRRFGGMDDVVRALDAAVARRDPRRRRARIAVGATAAALLLVVAGVAWARWQQRREAWQLNESGRAALARGDREAARRAFLAAHATDTRYEQACANLGYLAALEDNPSWAVSILEECVTEFPTSVPVLYNLGATLRLTGDLPQAESRLNAALEHATGHPLHPAVLNELALTLRASGRAAEAAKLLEPFAGGGAETIEAAVLARTRGFALLDAGDPAGAARSLQRALAGPLPPEYRAPALVALGRALEGAGERESALEAYSLALIEGAKDIVDAEARAGLARLQAHEEENR